MNLYNYTKNIYRWGLSIFYKIYGLLIWASTTPKVIMFKSTNKKRLLCVYDLTSQPFSIGDFINFNQASMVLGFKNEIEKIDIAIINNLTKINISKEFSKINSENSLYFLSSILPIVQINNKIGEIFILDSHISFERFVIENYKIYYIWPNLKKYINKNYCYYTVFDDIFYPFFLKNKYLPKLKLNSFLENWAINFFQLNLENQIPVTINLRLNKFHALDRNSNIEVWLIFFQYCLNKFNVKFIIICGYSEIDNRFRDLKNVILAKDLNTTIEEELSLINNSALHLGSASGPISVAWFSQNPYIMFSWNGDANTNKCIVKENEYFYKFNFATEMQKITNSQETFEVLIKEFPIMLEKSKYTLSRLEKSEIATSWLK